MNVTYAFLPRNANKRPGDRDGKKDVPRDWRKDGPRAIPKHVGPLQLL